MNIDNLFTMLKRYRGIVDITPHSIRHLCAVGMLRGGANILEIQELLGHSRLTSTQIYTHLHIEDLQAMHSKYHPRNSL